MMDGEAGLLHVRFAVHIRMRMQGIFDVNREGLEMDRRVAFDRTISIKTSLQRDADATKQVGEPGIGAKGIPEHLYFEVSETIEPLLVSLVQPREGLIFVFESGVNQRNEEGWYKTLLRSRLKLLDHL